MSDHRHTLEREEEEAAARVQHWCKRMETLIPGCWRALDEARAAHKGERGSAAWHPSHFLPMRAAARLAVPAAVRLAPDAAPQDDVAVEAWRLTVRLSLLAAWRVGKDVYRFDSDVARALADTPSGDVVLDQAILRRLPAWAVYVTIPPTTLLAPDNRIGEGALSDGIVRPDFNFERLTVRGALACLMQSDTNDSRLAIALDAGTDRVLGLALPLNMSVTDAVDASIREWDINARNFKAALRTYVADIKALLTVAVGEVLYLASEDADVTQDGASAPPRPRPTPTATKGGPRLFPPPTPTAWDVGVRIGAAIRHATAAGHDPSPRATGTGREKRPHIRRAHWHTFLAGPRTGERERRIRWLPPIAVKVGDVDALPGVVHPVELPTEDNAPCAPR